MSSSDSQTLDSTIQLLKQLKIRYSVKEVSTCLNFHYQKNTAKAIIDTLKWYGIQSVALDFSNMHFECRPSIENSICHYRHKEKYIFTYVKSIDPGCVSILINKKIIKVQLDEFNSNWNGVSILVSNQPNSKPFYVNNQIVILTILLLLFVNQISILHILSFATISILVLSFVGMILSVSTMFFKQGFLCYPIKTGQFIKSSYI